jgi:hypothetical protein
MGVEVFEGMEKEREVKVEREEREESSVERKHLAMYH